MNDLNHVCQRRGAQVQGALFHRAGGHDASAPSGWVLHSLLGSSPATKTSCGNRSVAGEGEARLGQQPRIEAAL